MHTVHNARIQLLATLLNTMAGTFTVGIAAPIAAGIFHGQAIPQGAGLSQPAARPAGPPWPPASSPRTTATSARHGKLKAEARPLGRQVKAGNDNRPVDQPAVAIVPAEKPRGRKGAWVDDGAEIRAAMVL
jgi:hypothetical protein